MLKAEMLMLLCYDAAVGIMNIYVIYMFCLVLTKCKKHTQLIKFTESGLDNKGRYVHAKRRYFQ